jgi:putative cardiolipin synthase
MFPRRYFRLPPLEARASDSNVSDVLMTALGRAVDAQCAAHPACSGVYELRDGSDALAARLLLIDAAEKSLDVQYYIWRNDLSGTLLFEALLRAADRGVQVSLLLDDNNTTGLDERLAALDAHAKIEVRLFNPFLMRRWRTLGYLTNFSRLNRRMHNKSLTADRRVTIVGGRNIGDEYFGFGSEVTFADLDVLVAGPAAHDMAQDFDRYWICEVAHPAARIIPAAEEGAAQRLRRDAEARARDPRAVCYLEAAARRPLVRQLIEGRLALDWVPVRLVSDDPAKALGRASEAALIWPRLKAALGTPQRRLELVSPYFVPNPAGSKALSNLVRQGVRVRVLTNSLAATDVALVHAGYAKRRRVLLAAGIELLELKRQFAGRSLRDRGLAGSSASTLHAKTFAVDGARVFVGSFNFDPRSARLNTETGMVIESPRLATMIADVLERDMVDRAYRVRLDAHGHLEWIERVEGRDVVHRSEPSGGPLREAVISAFSWLPIEWLL